MLKYAVILLFFVLMIFSCQCASASVERVEQALPIDAISGILAAFDSHSVVALGEGNHNNEQGHAFRLSLIRDPRFAAIVNDIVVEFGNALYQDVMDRFISGEEVPYKILRQAWQNTTQNTPVWDKPIYEEFFRAVRTINSSLSKEKQLRVLLGDPPIDWDKADRESFDEFHGQRDSYPANLIRKEVIDKGRRALVIYGDNHFFRRPLSFACVTAETVVEGDDSSPSLVALLENSGVTAFTIRTNTPPSEDIRTLQDDIKSWPLPSLVKLRDTILGVQDYGFYYSGVVMWKLIDGTQHEYRANSDVKMQDQFDALLYLGPPETITYSEVSVEFLCNSHYAEMRKAREKRIGNFEGAKRIQEYCDENMRIGAEQKQ